MKKRFLKKDRRDRYWYGFTGIATRTHCFGIDWIAAHYWARYGVTFNEDGAANWRERRQTAIEDFAISKGEERIGEIAL